MFTAIVWIVGVLLGFASLLAVPWLVGMMFRSLHRDWDKPTTGGCVFQPLQDLVQPQIRHVEQVATQRTMEDEDGGPLKPGRQIR